MSDFTQAYNLILANEGGYVNAPDDPGGETYKGIARKFHPEWTGWIIIDELKKTNSVMKTPITADEKEVNDQLQSSVRQFYLQEFWLKVKCNNLYNQQVAESIFDFAVNAGIETSVKLAQKVVGVYDDGVNGPATTAAINNFDPDHFMASFAVEKIRRYIQIISKRPSSRKFFEGWIIRSVSY